ncbi:MAG: MarR family transcriptional regulator [Hylemonella sp.]|nr:MarR family transcriptional regulator [Hylemonella sp.]
MTGRAPPRTADAADISEALHHAAQRTIELVYFAHVDQADWADHVLAKHDIGRPHHRVMYFANKFPGISVRELMAVLRITNQALARTTTQLVSLGFLEQRYGESDRRVRQHFLSRKGEALLSKLTRHQVEQVAKSMASMRHSEIDGLWFGLEAIIRPADRRWLLPRPDDMPRANELNDESAGGVTRGDAAGPAESGSGRPDRIFEPANQKAGTKRRQK